MRYLIIALLLVSCSPQQRLNKLLKKHPELSVTNTVIIKDTLMIPITEVDTIFSSKIDTMVVTNDSIKVTYIKVKDKIYLKGETLKVPVFVTKEVKVKSPVITQVVKVNKWYHKPLIWYSLIITIIIILYILLIIFKKYLLLI